MFSSRSLPVLFPFFLLLITSSSAAPSETLSTLLDSNIFISAASTSVTETSQLTSTNSRTLELPLTLVENPLYNASQLQKRGDFDVPLTNSFYYYSTTLEIGSPPQKVIVLVDTGSSDLWVRSPSSEYCQVNDCHKDNTFNENLSSTFHKIDPIVPFNIGYGGGNGGSGYMVLDNIALGNVAITQAEFAVLTSEHGSTLPHGNVPYSIFGLSFPYNEAVQDRNALYSNLPKKMVEQGLINTEAYSIWLDTKDSADGSLLFGGVDHAKYSGSLAVMPMINFWGSNLISTPTDLRVMLNSISALTDVHECELASFNIAVLLDSGTSFASLPPPLVAQFAAAMNYTKTDSTLFGYTGDCDVTTVDAFYLDFSGQKIRVNPSDLIWPSVSSDNHYVVKNGKLQCYLYISESTNSYDIILGDIFLQTMYTVFDLKNYEIAIAQSIHHASANDIEEIRDRIPGATSVARYFSTSTNPSVFSTSTIGSCFRLSSTSTKSTTSTSTSTTSTSTSTTSTSTSTTSTSTSTTSTSTSTTSTSTSTTSTSTSITSTSTSTTSTSTLTPTGSSTSTLTPTGSSTSTLTSTSSSTSTFTSTKSTFTSSTSTASTFTFTSTSSSTSTFSTSKPISTTTSTLTTLISSTSSTSKSSTPSSSPIASSTDDDGVFEFSISMVQTTLPGYIEF